eukprot:jgi/Ulvmu1/7624/UM038_0050.1
MSMWKKVKCAMCLSGGNGDSEAGGAAKRPRAARGRPQTLRRAMSSHGNGQAWPGMQELIAHGPVGEINLQPDADPAPPAEPFENAVVMQGVFAGMNQGSLASQQLSELGSIDLDRTGSGQEQSYPPAAPPGQEPETSGACDLCRQSRQHCRCKVTQ